MASLGVRDELAALETRLRWVVENLHDIVAFVDASGSIVYQSPTIERHLGYSAQELLGRNGFTLVHPEDVPGLRAAFERGLLRPGETIRHEYRFRHKDGSWRHVESAGVNLLGVEPVDAVVLISRDVTERRRAAEALRRSEERFHGAFDHATVGMALLSPLGRILEANRALCDMLDRAPEELRHVALAALSPAPERAANEALCDRFLTGALDTAQCEWRLLRPDGEVVWTQVSFSLQRDSTGAPLHLVAVVQDVTARKRAEAMEHHLAAIVQSSQDAIVSATAEGVITSWNPAAEHLFGYPAAEAIGQRLTLIVPPELQEETRRHVSLLRAGESFRDISCERVTRSGERIRVIVSLFPIRDATGAISGVCGMARRA